MQPTARSVFDNRARTRLTCIRWCPQAFDLGAFTIMVALVWGWLSLLPAEYLRLSALGYQYRQQAQIIQFGAG